jgi:hypothetical protein
VFGSIFAKGGLYDDVKVQEIKPEVKKVESEDEDEEDEIKHPEEPMEEEKPEDKAEVLPESQPAKEGEHLKSE